MAELGYGPKKKAPAPQPKRVQKPDPAIREKQLEDLIKQETVKAVQAKKAGDTNTAMSHLKKKKEYDKLLEEHREANPPGSWRQIEEAAPV